MPRPSSAYLASSAYALDAAMDLVAREPLSDALPFFDYGTAGFRFKADVMDGLMIRVGFMCAVLLMEQRKGCGKKEEETRDDGTTKVTLAFTTGVMITASHNDESYNGVKLANPDGSMLDPSQEETLTRWVNERNPAKFVQFLHVMAQTIVDIRGSSRTTSVASYVLEVGRDTRSHSPRLSNLLIEGANAFFRCVLSLQEEADSNPEFYPSCFLSARISDRGILTTPMLHHIVLHSNPMCLPSYIEPKASRKGYIETYAKAYIDLMEGIWESTPTAAPIPLRIDGACGVGFGAANELFEAIKHLSGEKFKQHTSTLFTVHNGELDGPLNDSCGSEHVQKELQPPSWYAPKTNTDVNNEDDDVSSSSFEFLYCCSLDGDADRIVFFGQKSKTELAQLLDGDKIAILIAHVLKEKLHSVIARASTSTGKEPLPEIKMGIVQTAYANGASTEYVRNMLEIPVEIAKTGVKHLHHAAVEHFDVGIYFEANGHGTVVFSKAYRCFADFCLEEHNDPFFVQLHRLINPAVGDALSDMLLVDYLLRALGGWTLGDWNNNLYRDLPSRMLKVRVKDRSVIECNSNESVCLQPESVQPLLQTAMEAYASGRCFIRPSGTEDVVRVYAEAKTREEADALANKASQIVFDTCSGVGPRPED